MAKFTIDLEDRIRPVLKRIDQVILALESLPLESSVNSQQNKESSMTDQRVTVSTAFEIIVHHFSSNTVLRKKEDIDDRVREAHEMQDGIPKFAENDPINTVLYALKQFGLADNPKHGYWRIKSVDDMCDRLHALVRNKESSMTGQPVTVSIAFEIIIHHFSGDTVLQSKKDIVNHVLDVHKMQGGIPKFAIADPVNKVLYYLKAFGLADNPEHGYWRIKSVDDMCDQLHALVRNRNIRDEGEDF